MANPVSGKVDQLRSLFSDFGIWTAVQVLAIIIGAIALYQVIRFLLPRLAELLPARFRILVLNTVPVARLTFLLVATIWCAALIFDVTLQNMMLVLSAIGVIIGFALKDFATSAFAGIVAVFERPYRTGDWIQVGSHYGEVITISTRALKIRTPDDNVVTIPHSRIWTENISNGNDGAYTLMCVARFTLDPAAPAPQVRQILHDIALSSPYLDWSHPIKVVTHNETYGTRVLLRAYPFEIRDQFDFITDLTERGRTALVAAGIRLIDIPDLGDGGA